MVLPIRYDVSRGQLGPADYLGLAQRVLVGLAGLILLAVVLLARRQVTRSQAT